MLLRERFWSADNPLHRLDARVKLIATLLVMLGLLSTPEGAWPAYPLLWALLASLAIVGELGVGRMARWGAVALPFALAAVPLVFTVPGDPVVTVARLTVSDAGLSRFITILLKSWLAAQTALLLTMTTPFTELLAALGALGLPPSLRLIIGLMYRYLTILMDEAQCLLRARAARSGTAEQGKTGGRLVWRAQVAGGMVGNLFLRSYERSERVYAAMLARGYGGRETVMPRQPLPRRDVLLGTLPVVVVVSIQFLARVWLSR